MIGSRPQTQPHQIAGPEVLDDALLVTGLHRWGRDEDGDEADQDGSEIHPQDFLEIVIFLATTAINFSTGSA